MTIISQIVFFLVWFTILTIIMGPATALPFSIAVYIIHMMDSGDF
ncbi:MAG: hypothetical protein ACYDBV_14880 [Nitrospiria bacterium]